MYCTCTCTAAASPLRLYGQDSIVSVQCPVKVFRKTIDEALSNKLKKWVPYLNKTGNDIEINTKSSWYVGIQGQLHITGETERLSCIEIILHSFVLHLERKFAYLIVWLGTEFVIKKVVVDHAFWKNSMKDKLQFFFDEAMIKELADPRKARKMDLRSYDPKTKTFF